MPIETVIRHDPPQIGVPDEENPKQVVHLPLIPIRPIVEPRDARDWRGFVSVCLDSDSRVVSDAEEVVDDLKALVLGGIVHCCDIRYHCVLGCGVVLEERHDRDDAGGRDIDGEFVLPDGELLDVSWETGEEVLAVGVEARGLVLVFVGGVDERCMEFSSGYTRELVTCAHGEHLMVHTRSLCVSHIRDIVL